MNRVLALACLCLCLPSVARGQQQIRVPFGAAPSVDGNVDAREWRGSAVALLADSSQVQLRHDGRYVYIAVKGSRAGFINACVSRNDTIRILHASAALGTAMYVPTDTGWALVAPFRWAMRAREMSDETRARQREFLGSSRWLASTQQLSEREKEMQIDLGLLDEARMSIGLGYHVGDEGPVLPLPKPLADDCVDGRLVAGHLPATARFNRSYWLGLVLEGTGAYRRRVR